MSSQNHIIRQQVFEVDFPAREQVQDLYDKTSSLFNNELAGRMEALFDELIPVDQLLKIDMLEIDLGSCKYGDYEQTLLEKLIPALEKELSARLLLKNHDQVSGDSEASASKTSYAALLSYYLTTGTLPWWAVGEVLTDPGKTFDQLLAENPAALKNLLHQTAQYDDVRYRLVYQFSEKQLRAVITLFEPQQAAFIFGYHEELVLIQQEKQVVQSETSEFKKALWLFILTFLLIDRGSHFDRKMFVKSTLSQMAAHYNISYEMLLLLFSSAIEADQQLTQANQALPSLIRELLEEHVHAHPFEELDKRYKQNKKDAQALVLQKQYDVLRHYLLLGSLPWTDTYSREELAAAFMALKNAAPGLARQLLMDAGQEEDARKRMVAFEEPFVIEMVKLVEPAQSDFIIDYSAKLQKIQASKYIVKVRNEQFRHALWEFILVFLFTDTGSVFNTKMFVEDHVRRMARHYNLQFHELLVFLAQGIGEDYRSFTDNTSLFYLLTGILKEHSNDEASTPREKNTTTGIDPVEPGRKNPAPVVLRDVLSYWLEYGLMPWWAEEFLQHSPGDIFSELIRCSPADAVLLLKLAGSNSRMKSRMVQQLPEETILELFALLPGNTEALKALSTFTALAKKNNSPYDAGIQKLLLSALWGSYQAASFESFGPGTFLSISIPDISAALQWPEKKLIALLKQDDETLFSMIPETLKQADASQRRSPALLIDSPINVDLQELLMQQESAAQPLSKNRLLEESIRLLEYFLVWNTWPGDIKIPAGHGPDDLLRQLIALIYRENSQALKNILQKDTHAAPARMRLHDAFSLNTNSLEKNAAALLSEHFNGDVIRYLKDNGHIGLQEGEKLSSLFNRVLQLSDPKVQQETWRRLFYSPAMIRHAAYHYRGDEFYNVLRAVGIERSEGFLKDLQYMLNMASRDTMEREQMALLFREFSLLFFSRPSSTPDPALYFREFFVFLAARGKNNMSALYASLSKVSTELVDHKASGIAQLIPVLQDEIKKQAGFEADRASLEALMNASSQRALENFGTARPAEQQQSTLDKLMRELDHKKHIEEDTMKKTASVPDEEKIYIHNAGLVLLHPFLSIFFARTGLMENNRFASEEKQRRAVNLLQYIATGTTEHDEHLLVLNKLLCGLAPGAPVEKNLILTDQEKQVTHEMLSMVIERWEKIGKPSVDGFRGSFLVRDGALTPGDEVWTLRVEQRGYDVLLQTLPWAYGMIKTSWMHKPVHVEWM